MDEVEWFITVSFANWDNGLEKLLAKHATRGSLVGFFTKISVVLLIFFIIDFLTILFSIKSIHLFLSVTISWTKPENINCEIPGIL